MTCSLNEGAKPPARPLLHSGIVELKVIGMILLVPMCFRSQLVKPRTDPAWLKVGTTFMPQARWEVFFWVGFGDCISSGRAYGTCTVLEYK